MIINSSTSSKLLSVYPIIFQSLEWLKELQPIIEVENGFGEEGSFMLTTVRMGRANMYSYLIAKWSEYQEIYPLDEIKSEEETDEEYNVRQLYLMDSSKSNAIEVAYKKAGIPVDYRYKGVYVLNVVTGYACRR